MTENNDGSGSLRIGEDEVSQTYEHAPVMLKEVLETFEPLKEGLFVDATVGGGGHAHAILEQGPNRFLIGLDRDPNAVQATKERLRQLAERAEVVHARFDQIASVIDSEGRELTGAIFDLGVSSHQLDTPDRGFSPRHDAPLDMRMDPNQDLNASTVVNTYTEDELAWLLRTNADERFARRIAKSIAAPRPIRSTTELAELVREAVPAAARRTGKHPARRTFQAIRIAVNDELEQIELALKQTIERLTPGGRIVVLSYHSGEDKIVKQVLREAADGVCECPSTLPCICDSEPNVKLLRRKVVRPTTEEIEATPRAASARFRAAERLSVSEL